MTYPELSFDVTDGHGLDKLFVLICLSPCFIKLGVVRLCIFVLLCKLPESYEKKTVPCILRISILEVRRFLELFLCGFREKMLLVVITRWCNFRQQRSVLTQF